MEALTFGATMQEEILFLISLFKVLCMVPINGELKLQLLVNVSVCLTH